MLIHAGTLKAYQELQMHPYIETWCAIVLFLTVTVHDGIEKAKVRATTKLFFLARSARYK